MDNKIILGVFLILVLVGISTFSVAYGDTYLRLKATANQANDTLIISDSNNNTMLRTDKGGNLVVNPLAVFQHGLIAGNNSNSEVNPMIVVARSYSGNGFAHAYSDISQYNSAVNGGAYDSFDAVSQIVGSHNLDHVRGYQVKMTQSGTGTIGELSGFGVFSLTDNAGTTTNVKEFGGVDTTGTATVTNQYGFYMPDLLHGVNNWAIFTNKGKAHFGDDTDISGKLNVNNQTTVAGLHIAITAEKTSTNYNISYKDDVVVANASLAMRTVTLPSASGDGVGKIYYIKDVGYSSGNVVQILTSNGQTIDGFNGFNMTHAGDVFIVQSNGTAWNKMHDDDPSAITYAFRPSTTRWVSSAVTAFGTSTSVDAASTMYAIPWVVSNNVQIDRMGIETTAAANPTSTTCNLGIYTDTGNNYPLNLVSGSDTGTNTMTLGMRTYNFTTPITLHQGLYWKVLSCGTAGVSQPTFRAEGQGSVPAVLGWTSTGGLSQSGNMYRIATTYGPLPAVFPAGATVNVTNVLAAFQILVEIKKG